MNDQCKWCIQKGNLTTCQSVECYQRENWYVMQLQQQIEDMKCCGNCKNYIKHDDMPRCYVDGNYDYCKKSDNVCPKWQSDNLTRKERMV